LEFPVVILPSLGKRFNRTDLNENAVWDRDGGFFTRFLPGRRYGEDRTSIARQLILPKLQDRLRSEELRLLYVAMTRAREKLYMTASARNMTSKIAEYQELTNLSRAECEARTAEANCFLDWTLLAISRRPELSQLSASRPRVASEDSRVAINFVPNARA